MSYTQLANQNISMLSGPKVGTLFLYLLLTFCMLSPLGMDLFAQDEVKTEKEAKDEEKKAKKSLKEVLTFKNFLHHSDSSRLAKRYIRWHKKLTRGDKDYRFTIYKDELSDLFPFVRKNKHLLTKEVFGWYPSWEKDLYKSLDFSLISTVAYFSYEVNHKTGKADTIHEWMTTPLIDEIKKYDDKNILLTVSLFGNSEVKSFLKNTKACDVLIENVIKLLDARKGNGVCIDFEGVVNSQRNNYNSFIADFSQRLKNHNKDYLVYLTVPAVDWNESLQYDILTPAVDQFVVMGYNYYGSTSKVAGPVSPLESGKIWDPFNLTTSVQYYLDNGIPNNKIILALPFYGSIWETKTGNKGSRANRFVGSRTIDYIKSEMDKEPSLIRQYDTVSHTSWYSYVVKDTIKNKRTFRQLWFDSDSAFAEKLNFIREKELSGMGIWALGYNKHFDNYWREIERNFCVPPDSIQLTRPYKMEYPDSIIVIFEGSPTMADSTMVGDKTNKAKKLSEVAVAPGPTLIDKLKAFNAKLKQISGMNDLLLWALGFVVLFGGLGFVIAMFKAETRMFFFNSKAYTIYFTAIIALFLMVLMRKLNAIEDTSVVLLFGFVAGAMIVFLVNKYVQKVKRNLP